MSHFVHPDGICESIHVGSGTKVWAFAHVLSGARIGIDCNLCDHVFVENDVVLGDRVTVKCGVQLWDGVTLEDDVFVGPNATFTNDRFPRSKQYQTAVKRTTVKRGASIGANATILPGVTIGMRAMVGAGAVVTRSVPANAVVVGNPARVVGYGGSELRSAEDASGSSVHGVTWHRMKRHSDPRGILTVGEFERELPFLPKRFFIVTGVESKHVRGEHAHRKCAQLLICTAGSVRVLADDGVHREEILLDSPDFGLHLPPMTWGTQYEYSRHASLLVFASHPYDVSDYIRDYEEFLEVLANSVPGRRPMVA